MITGIGFEFAHPSSFDYVVVSNIQINFSTTSKAVDGLSTTFAQNVGADDKKVFGPANASWTSAQASLSFGAPAFTLSSPFFYDPAKGNLLVDMRVYNGATSIFLGGIGGNSDVGAVSDNSDSVSLLGAFNVNALTGARDTIGLSTLFTVTPIPEPATWALLLLGAPAIFMAIQRKRNHKSQMKG